MAEAQSTIDRGERKRPPKILERELDPGIEVLEYYEVEEEGVDVPMVADPEPYLHRDVEKRPISLLRPEELMTVLVDQRAKDIVCFQAPMGEENSIQCHPYTIICSPYNKRHAKALDIVVRAFMKRNFKFEHQAQAPSRLDKHPSGWYSLDLRNVALHIMEEDLRKKYNLESLILGLDDEEDPGAWWNANDYKVPEGMLVEKVEKPEKGTRLTGTHLDAYIRPHI